MNLSEPHVPWPPYPVPPPMSVAESRAIDVVAVEQWGYPSVVLMENAGRNAAAVLYGWIPPHTRTSTRVVVLCGVGNNGGDGLVIARHLHNAGVDTHVVLAGPIVRLSPGAAINYRIFERVGGVITLCENEPSLSEISAIMGTAGFVVDALLGNGSKGPPRGAMAELIRIANGLPSHVTRVAIDLPSGLDADSGLAHDPTFRADATITMVSTKRGFAQAADWVGRVVTVDIGAPAISSPRA